MRHSPGHLRASLVPNEGSPLHRQAQGSEGLHRAIADALGVGEVHGGRNVTVMVRGYVEGEVVCIDGVEVAIKLLRMARHSMTCGTAQHTTVGAALSPSTGQVHGSVHKTGRKRVTAHGILQIKILMACGFHELDKVFITS